MNIPKCNKNGGFSMVEVLVALLVLSIGLLGLAMLQVEGMKLNSDAYNRTQATILANDLFERLKANQVAAHGTGYCLDGAGTSPALKDCTNKKPAVAEYCGDSAAGCDSALDSAKYDLYQWYQMVESRIPLDPNNPPYITRDPAGSPAFVRYSLTMRWQEHDLLLEQTWTVDI